MAASTRFSQVVPHHWFLGLIPVKPASFFPSVYCLDYRILSSPLDHYLLVFYSSHMSVSAFQQHNCLGHNSNPKSAAGTLLLSSVLWHQSCTGSGLFHIAQEPNPTSLTSRHTPCSRQWENIFQHIKDWLNDIPKCFSDLQPKENTFTVTTWICLLIWSAWSVKWTVVKMKTKWGQGNEEQWSKSMTTEYRESP